MKRKERDRNEEDETDTSEESVLDSLPYDLKLAILTRMTAKSLKNFRRVSKMWSSIIRSRGFIDSFSSISSRRPRFIVALSNGYYNQGSESLVFFFSFSSEDQGEYSVANFEMAIPSISFGEPFGYCTSLHGLLVVGADEGTRICNPCTEQVLKLPFPTKYVGYDPIGDQYKALTVNDRRSSKNDKAFIGHKVLTLGKDGGWRHIESPAMTTHIHSDSGISINGFVYYGAFSPISGQYCIVCFDVRSEKLSYIEAPHVVVPNGHNAAFIEYKGKLASIARNIFGRFQEFELWVLEDVEKHKWSKTTCVFPLSVWDYVEGFKISILGTNKAGEIIMAPRELLSNGRPYYIFYYNVKTQNIRRVRLRGIGDSQEFRRCYGLVDKGPCEVRIAPQHIESIAFFNNSITVPEF